jgi:hypothetical protein
VKLTTRYIGISEAMSIDGRQALTLTNFDPTHLGFASFPITWPITILAIFEGTEVSGEAPGSPFTGQISVVDPSGQSAFASPLAGATQDRPFTDLPPRFLFGTTVALNLAEPGDYRVEVSLTYQGETITGERPIYIRKV